MRFVEIISRAGGAERRVQVPIEQVLAELFTTAAQIPFTGVDDASFVSPNASIFLAEQDNIVISGAGTAEANSPSLSPIGLQNGRITYGSLSTLQVYWDPDDVTGAWLIFDNDLGTGYYKSFDDVATPDLVTTWVAVGDGIAPVPEVTASPTVVRVTPTTLLGYSGAYVASLSQSSTDAPTASVKQNTIGGVPLQYVGVGQYRIVNDAFTVADTIVVHQGGDGIAVTKAEGAIEIDTGANDVLDDWSIVIYVYE